MCDVNNPESHNDRRQMDSEVSSFKDSSHLRDDEPSGKLTSHDRTSRSSNPSLLSSSPYAHPSFTLISLIERVSKEIRQREGKRKSGITVRSTEDCGCTTRWSEILLDKPIISSPSWNKNRIRDCCWYDLFMWRNETQMRCKPMIEKSAE